MPLNEGAINEIMQFAAEGLEDAGDILSLEEYENHPMRMRGHMVGLALRELQNREARQATHMAAGLAQFIANRYAPGVVDDGDLDKVEGGLSQAIESKAVPYLYNASTLYSKGQLCLNNTGLIMQALQSSGPSTGAGPQPTTNTEYWQQFGADPATYFLLQRLTAPLSLYVDGTSGNDEKGDGTQSAPYKTISHAVIKATSTYYLGVYSITIRIAAGTYGETVNLPSYLTSTGMIVLTGAGVDQTVIKGPALSASMSLGVASRYGVANLTLETPSIGGNANACTCSAGELVLQGVKLRSIGHATYQRSPLYTQGSNVLRFAAGTTNQIEFGPGASLGGIISSGGTIWQEGNIAVVTQPGAYMQNGFCYVTGGSLFSRGGAMPVITGSIPTGPRYVIYGNGFIDTRGGGPNYFPGTTAGAIPQGGQQYV